MRSAILAAILVSATAASAFGDHTKPVAMVARGGKVTYRKLSPIDDDHAKLRLVLTTSSTTACEVSVPITIPDRFVVTGLSLSMTGEDPVTAKPRLIGEARDAYERIVAQIKDPALVEWTDDHH
ncbi:MAG: hypothetical protein H0V17_12330, partial [Deltaproteobacteria bacterium]|nr:hypothetical protein [Deltaproteobacteria bacterium]